MLNAICEFGLGIEGEIDLKNDFNEVFEWLLEEGTSL